MSGPWRPSVIAGPVVGAHVEAKEGQGDWSENRLPTGSLAGSIPPLNSAVNANDLALVKPCWDGVFGGNRCNIAITLIYLQKGETEAQACVNARLQQLERPLATLW